MNAKRKKRLLLLVGGLFGLSLMITLVFVALNENMNMFFTPTQFVREDIPQGPTVKVGGLVVPGSVKRNDSNLEVVFDLTDNQEEVRVRYDGILPDLFREGQGIIAKGHWDGKEVIAFEVLAKHDETYMPPEVQEALEKAGHPAKQQ